MMPTLTIAPDPSWFESTWMFRDLVGGALALVLLLAVIAIVVAGAGLVLGKMSAHGAAVVPQEALLRVLIGALVAASLSGLVAWSFTFNLNLTGFSGDGVERAMFTVKHPNVAAPDYVPCSKPSDILLIECN